ncbi:MAG: cell division protein FtsZ [Rickettsiales bacterium]|nr:cell division protein FtsZ [Rickettsiales bacterium]
MSENTLHISLKKTEHYGRLPKIVVMGVGGGGCNAINNMMERHISGIEFIAANTDIQSLMNSKAEKVIQLGKNTTKGQGAGSFPEVGLAAAEETKDEIKEALKDTQLLFLTAGMGGGTGTGAAPVIAKIAKEMDILTVAVVTKPFKYEAEIRLQLAEYGINELKKYVDTMIVLPNENLFRIANKDTTLKDAFMTSDNVLYLGVRGITDLITMPGLINLDFADVRMVIKKMGRAMMGMGEAEGENRAIRAVEEALSNPLLEDVNIKGATGALVNITGSPDITLFEFDEAAKRIREEIGGSEAIIKVGTAFLKELEGKIRVSIFATGIREQTDADAAQPYTLKKTTIDYSLEKNGGNTSEETKVSIETEKSTITQQTKITNEETRSLGKTRIASQVNNSALFDTGRPVIVEELEESKTQKGLFDLFNIMSSKNKDKVESSKETEKSVNSYKLKNREIEFRDNVIHDNIDEKLLNIPAYLRKKK